MEDTVHWEGKVKHDGKRRHAEVLQYASRMGDKIFKKYKKKNLACKYFFEIPKYSL